MRKLDLHFTLGCGPRTDYPWTHIFQCLLERTDSITNEFLEPVTFVIAYPTVFLVSSAANISNFFRVRFWGRGEGEGRRVECWRVRGGRGRATEGKDKVLSNELTVPCVRYFFLITEFNLYAPCILYIGQTYHYSPQYTSYIFSQQIIFNYFF